MELKANEIILFQLLSDFTVARKLFLLCCKSSPSFTLLTSGLPKDTNHGQNNCLGIGFLVIFVQDTKKILFHKPGYISKSVSMPSIEEMCQCKPSN